MDLATVRLVKSNARKPLVRRQHCICRMLRQSFLTMLKEDFGVKLVGDPQSYFDMPLTNQIDLGQGNTVMPYVVNNLANLRIMTKINYNTSEDPGRVTVYGSDMATNNNCSSLDFLGFKGFYLELVKFRISRHFLYLNMLSIE